MLLVAEANFVVVGPILACRAKPNSTKLDKRAFKSLGCAVYLPTKLY